MLWTLLDLLEEDVDLDGEHQGEENQEEEEGNHHTRRLEVADSRPCGEHVLNGPWLTSELSD